jgi:hypothetical protein
MFPVVHALRAEGGFAWSPASPRSIAACSIRFWRLPASCPITISI